MAGESNRPGTTTNRGLILRVGEWSSGPLRLARTHRQRRRGVIPEVGPFGLLIRARSIHGWGLTAALRWVGLDGAGIVIATGILAPWRVVVPPSTVLWVVEVPGWLGPPPIGAPAIAVPILVGWPDD